MHESADYEGRPRKLDSGEWGVSIWEEVPVVRPAPGDLVHVTTRNGAEFLAEIDAVEEEHLWRGVILFVCGSRIQSWL